MAEPIATWNPTKMTWETFQPDLSGRSVSFSETWPTSGMTRAGRAFALPTPALHMGASESSSLLATTPAVNDMGEGKTPDAWDAWDAWTTQMRQRHGNGNGHGDSLAIQAQRLLPTPTASDGERSTTYYPGNHNPTLIGALLPTPEAYDGSRGGPQDPAKRKAGGHSVSLQDVTFALLGTPRVTTSGMSASQAAVDRGETKGRLEAQVALLPTPRAQNAEDRNRTVWERPLSEPQNLENALARLPGESTSPPSDGGSTSLGDQLPFPPNLADGERDS